MTRQYTKVVIYGLIMFLSVVLLELLMVSA